MFMLGKIWIGQNVSVLGPNLALFGSNLAKNVVFLPISLKRHVECS